jgi:ABC-type polysaccharide/polyol phosphate export permease
MAWFFMSPVIYTLDYIGAAAPSWALPIYKLNPMVGIITLYRSLIIGASTPGILTIAAAFVLPFIFLALGIAAFSRHEPDFADEL